MPELIRDTIQAGLIHLDTDSDYYAMPKGGSPYVLNVDIQEGNLNVRSRALGNVVQTKALAAGTNVIIGGCEDKENNGFIYFVANSNDDDSIIRYNYAGTFTDISTSEDWGFDSGYKINSCGIVGNGNDAQLWWTDYNSEIRKVNIYHEINTYASNDYGNSYLMKPSPLAPTFTFLDNTDRNINNIQNHIFQFCCQFVFDTGETSHWGHISKLAFDYENDIFSYYNFIDQQYSNGIRLTIITGYANIDKVNIAFREVDVGSGATSDWFLAGDVDYSVTSVTFDFFNDVKYPLAQSEFEYNYYDVPRLARVGCSLKDNRIALGDVTKDRDATTLDVTLTHAYKSVTNSNFKHVISYTNGTGKFILFDDFGYDADEERYIKLYIKGLTTTGADADNWVLYGTLEEYVLPSDYYKTSANDNVDFFVDKINADTSYDITASRVAGDLKIARDTDNDNDISATIIYGYNNNKYLTLPSGSTSCWGLCYYDQFGRSGRVDLPSTADMYISTLYANGYINKAEFEIDHVPPSWATHYRFMFGGTNIEKIFTLPMVVRTGLHFNEADFYKKGSYVHIKYSQMLDRIHDVKDDLNIEAFEVMAGDYLRPIGYFVYQDYDVDNAQEQAIVFTNNTEFKILDVIEFEDGLNEKELVIESWDFHANEDIFNGDVAEKDVLLMQFIAYKKNTDTKNLNYQEVGDLMAITAGAHTVTSYAGYSDGVGAITTRNQTVSGGVSTQSAIGIIDFGNLFLTSFNFIDKLRLNNEADSIGGVTPFIALFESENASYSYLSTYNQYGNINIYDNEFKERTQNAIMWGGTYSEDGITFNELNKFLSSNIKYLDDKHGGVYGMEEEGYTLNVIQKSKLTTLGIGVDEISNADGSSQLITISDVLSKPRPMVEDLGTVYPFSVVKNNRYVYYYDIYAGEVIRKAPNGQETISDYGMSKYFRDKSIALLTSGITNVQVTAGWDPVKKFYVLSFIDSQTAANSDTVAFHEPSNQWITHYSFQADLYGNVGENIFISFKTGVLYKHHDETVDAAYFYGVAYDSYVWLVFNEYPDLVKRFLTISEISNDPWAAPDTTGILIASDAIEHEDVNNYDRFKADMTSRLKEGQFRYRNGEWRAEFLRDAKTTTGSFYVPDLVNGRVLTGNNLLIKLFNDNTNAVYLRSVTVNSVPSR